MTNEMKLTSLALASVVAFSLPLTASAQNYRVRTQIDTTVRLDRNGIVDLSLISGRIRVTGWDRQDVKLVASIDRGMLRFDANSSRVSLTVDESDDDDRHNHNVGDATYDVSVARGSAWTMSIFPPPAPRAWW